MQADVTELVEFAAGPHRRQRLAVGCRAEHATRTIPIVFSLVIDPVEQGFVASLARPGGNITGFTNFDFSTVVKWLELLRRSLPASDG